MELTRISNYDNYRMVAKNHNRARISHSRRKEQFMHNVKRTAIHIAAGAIVLSALFWLATLGV